MICLTVLGHPGLMAFVQNGDASESSIEGPAAEAVNALAIASFVVQCQRASSPTRPEASVSVGLATETMPE